MLNKNPPVIVIGMHRSGTSFFSRLMQSNNIFMGKYLEANGESRFFLKLHEDGLRHLGVGWDTCNFYRLEDFYLAMEYLEDYFLRSTNRLNFPNLYSGFNLKFPERWGWKDPRTSLFLSIWLKRFPDANIIHVIRHPMAVAKSLMLRSQNSFTRTYSTGRLIRERLGIGRFLFNGINNLDLEHCLELWLFYVRAARYAADHPNYLEVKYEELSLDGVYNNIASNLKLPIPNLNAEKFMPKNPLLEQEFELFRSTLFYQRNYKLLKSIGYQ